jgi:hypothetical protein
MQRRGQIVIVSGEPGRQSEARRVFHRQSESCTATDKREYVGGLQHNNEQSRACARTRISRADMQRICDAPDTDTLAGRMHRALLLTLATTGLRSGHATGRARQLPGVEPAWSQAHRDDGAELRVGFGAARRDG